MQLNKIYWPVEFEKFNLIETERRYLKGNKISTESNGRLPQE